MSGVLLFGGSGGIGSSIARDLVRRQIPVCLAGRNEERLALRASEVGATGYVVADVTSMEQVEAAFASAGEMLGGVRGVAHCVGSILLKPAHLTSESEFVDVVSVNLTSAFRVVRTAARVMTSGGSVVLFSSAAARIGLANHEAIAAAKAGIIGLTLSAAATYAARGLRINCVAPGLVATQLSEKITSNPASAAFSTTLHPLGRLGQPDDVGAIAGLLLGDDASWITGQVFGVDGGLGTLKVVSQK
jgi:3-oxoacyl-[acyl-carrier protein] reductase